MSKRTTERLTADERARIREMIDVGNYCRNDRWEGYVLSLLDDADELDAAKEALGAAEGIMWMAENYAEAGGSGGIEMEDFRAAREVMQRAKA
jgi:hypothetical protein